MNLADLRARMRRLEALAFELMQEAHGVRHAPTSVLLPNERQSYLLALDRTLYGVEAARVALAAQRLEG